MNTIDQIKNCYGCGACNNACPAKAITMKENEFGFLKATVNKSTCINCGRCTIVCPRFEHRYNNAKQPACYAVWGEDEIRKTCASGGVFTAIAKDFLKKENSYICGAVWADDFRVEHILTNDVKKISDIQNSKYVQSNTKVVYSKIKEVLDKRGQVLFCGTPCQVAGLYSFLGDEYDGLYTMDLVCHGTPSSKILKKYLIDTYPDAYIRKVDFRDKSVFGWSTEMNIYFEEKKEVHRRASEDSFFKAFLSNMSLNPTCESCQFSCLPRQGDLSIGDFWNIEKYDKELNDGKGTSLVLINSSKGMELFSKCDSFVMSKEVPFDFLRSTCNQTIFRPFRHHYGSDRFLREFDRINFSKAVDQCLDFKYDIGLVTTWFARNYGAIFTAYALYKQLVNMGYTVLMVNRPENLWERDYDGPNRNAIAKEFGTRYYNISKQYSLDKYNNISILNNHCESFIVGSDQLWNPKVYANKYYFFLDFVDACKRKIAFATSVGASQFEGTKDDKRRVAYYLSRFSDISNREDEAVDLCKREFEITTERVLDPVFLLDVSEYDDMIANSKVELEGEYIFAYILDGNEEKRRLINQLAEMTNLPIICAYDIENPDESIHFMEYEERKIDKPEDWLWYIKNAKYVVTDSYHGGCFSVIFQKKFICFVNELRGAGRFKELFTRLGLESNLIYADKQNEDLYSMLHSQIDYSIINKRLILEKSYSIDWLKNALEKNIGPMDTEEFVISSMRNEIMRKYQVQMFCDIHQMGIESGCTVQQIIDKMPDNSYLQQVQGNGSPIVDTPVPYGILTIKRTTYYFVEVRFTQMTYKNIRPITFIGNVIDGKLSSWEKFVGETEMNHVLMDYKNQVDNLCDKVLKIEQQIVELRKGHTVDEI